MVQEAHNNIQHKIGFNSFTIKLIAVVTMFIDHFSAYVLGELILTNYQSALSNDLYNIYYSIYYAGRMIGRISFPIFAFLIVEGFSKTSNKLKYFLRILITAIISEPIYDYVLNDGIVDLSNQNILFLYALALLVLIIIEYTKKLLQGKIQYNIFCLGCVLVGCLISHFAKLDYGIYGFFLVILIYILKHKVIFKDENKIIRIGILTAYLGVYQIYSTLAVIPIALYNGKRGPNLKYLFYAFYPVHICIIYLIGRIVTMHI